MVLTSLITENARNLHASTATTFASFVEQLRSVEEARARREAQEQLEKRDSARESLIKLCRYAHSARQR